MNKIRLVSKILQFIFLFFIFVLPALTILCWFYMKNPNDLSMHTTLLPLTNNPFNAPDFPARLVGFLVNLIPLSIQLFCLYISMKLFKLYEQGKIFTLKNVRYIRYISIALIAQEIIKPFNQIITTYILTLHNPPGYRVIAVSLTNQDLSNLIIGVVILLASWIMTEACKLHDEHTLTI